MKRYFTVKTVALSFAIVFALYLLLAGFVAPWAGKRIAVNSLTKTLGRQAQIESITFNPFTLETRVKNVAIESKIKGENLASIQQVYLNLSMASLLHLAPVISSVEVTAPEFALHLNKDNSLNISDLLEGKKDTPEPEPKKNESKALFGFKVSNIKITDAALVFTDHIRSVTHSVTKLNFDLPLVSSMKKDIATPIKAALDCLVNNARVDLKATGVPFDASQKMSVSLDMQPLDLNAFTPYIDLPELFKIKSAGNLAVSISGEYEIPAGKTAKTANISTQTSEIAKPDSNPEAKQGASTSTDQVAKVAQNPTVQDQTEPDQAVTKQEPKKSVKPMIALSLPFDVKIKQAAVKIMNINFIDKMVSPEVSKTISNLNFTLSDVKVSTGAAGNFDLQILTGDNEKIKTAGNFHIQNDIAANGQFSVDGIALKNYRPYLAPYLGDNVSLENIAASLNFKVNLTKAGLDAQVSGGQVTLDKFGLTQQGKKEPLVTFDQLALSEISCNLLKQEASVGLVKLQKAHAKVNRDKKGQMDLLVAIEQALKTKNAPGEKSSTPKPAKTDEKTAKQKPTEQKSVKQEGKNASAPAWLATIDKTVLDHCQVQFIDQAKKEPVKVVMKNIGVTVKNISTKKGETSTFKVSMTNKNKGKINLNGSFDISGPAATVNIDLNRIDVNTAEPYFTDFLKISIPKGYLNTKGKVVVTPAKKKSGSPKITYKGMVSLNNFLSKNKVDNTDFFSCKSLYATGMNISVNPMKVVIQKIALTDFYQRAILNKDAHLNYKQIMMEQPADKRAAKAKPKRKKASPKTDSSMPDIHIKTITLQGGHIDFSDYFTKPNFTANMTQIAGSLTGLSSRGKERANLVLKGVHGGYAPLDITGQLDPLKAKRFIDLIVSFKNIELPKFNVYSKKYLGYEIEKGKLILDLHYNIDGDKLNSNNRILFDQLTLGKKVESKDAPSLPLELALSLLKNSKGEIDLDLPITGDISDPKFHFGKVVGTVLKNFFMGIVTSPFKFLGGLVGAGSGQDLGYVEFDPGSSELDKAQKAKLDKLIEVLVKKKQLKLETLCPYNKLSDAEQLRYNAYETIVLSMDKKLPANSRIKLVSLGNAKRTRLIEKAYKKASFPKPRDADGKQKDLTLEEKEKLLVTSMPLDGDALNALGRQRGHEIADHLTKTGEVDIRRVFVTEPDPVATDEESSTRIKATFDLKP